MKKRRPMMTALLALAVAGAAGCDRSPVDPPGHDRLGKVEILDRSVVPNVVIATWTYPDGWAENLLTTLSHSTEEDRTRVSLGVRMYTRGGQEFALVEDGEYEARYGVSDPDNVINMDPALGLFHGDHVHIYGYHQEGRTGTAQITFALWHDDHDDGTTHPIAIEVVP
jgi:hypothetical protein